MTIKTEATLQLRKMVTGFPDAGVAGPQSNLVLHLQEYRLAVPDTVNAMTRVERFDWLSDNVDILRLAKEADHATAPDGPPLSQAA